MNSYFGDAYIVPFSANKRAVKSYPEVVNTNNILVKSYYGTANSNKQAFFELDYKEKYLSGNKKILNYHDPDLFKIKDSIYYIQQFFSSCCGCETPESIKEKLKVLPYKYEITNSLIRIKDVVYNPEIGKFGYVFFDDFLLYEGDVIKKNNSIYVFVFSPNTFRFVFFDVDDKKEVSIKDFVKKHGLLYPVHNIDVPNDYLVILNNKLGLHLTYKNKEYCILDGDSFPKYVNQNSVFFIKFTDDGFYSHLLYIYLCEKVKIINLTEETVNTLLGELSYNEETKYLLESRQYN